ncbi:MAG: hypothetical protein BKP49_05115 [Treponema sp. CETP13]|nr:MAG: hypothetical protein BKP49_05115 [Treponema sp. CETP13]
MKFSVWDYSQVKIAQFNEAHPNLAIDPTDIFIFTWFKGFATKTRAKTLKKDGSKAKGMWSKTIDGVDYFNVRYGAIIRDYPILGVCNVKSIQRRFDKYVEAGIFDKTIVHAGKKGNFTYFAFTESFFSFEYDNDNPEHKELNKNVDTEQKQNVQTKPIGVDKNVQTKPIGVDKNVQTKPIGVDKNVQTKPIGVDKNVQTKPVGVDKNVQTLIYNPVTSLNNSATTSSNPVKTIQTAQFADKNSEEEVFLNIIIKLFGYNPCFNPNPYPIFVQNLKNCNLSLNYLEEYLTWIFTDLKPRCKNKDNFVSYFFKSFTQPVYISKFAHIKKIEIQKLEEKKARQIICPVCGCVHDKNDYFCPNEECKYPGEMLNDENNIQKEKAIFQLKKNDNSKYQEYQRELNKLIEKYPMTKWIMNKEIKQEFDNLVSELEIKYLNIKKTA